MTFVLYYARLDGDDANPCTCAAPCRTIARAAAVAMLNTTPGTAVVDVGPGGWAECININGDPPSYPNARSGPFPPWVGLLFQGDGNNTVWRGDTSQAGVLIVNGGANVAVRNMALGGNAARSDQSVLYAQLGGHGHVLDNVLALDTPAAFMHGEDVGSYWQTWNDISILGGVTMQSFGNAVTGAMVKINGGVVTFNGPIPSNPTMTEGLFTASGSGANILIGPGVSFAGSINGRAYSISDNATIDCGGFTRAPFTPGCQSVEGLGNVAAVLANGGRCR